MVFEQFHACSIRPHGLISVEDSAPQSNLPQLAGGCTLRPRTFLLGRSSPHPLTSMAKCLFGVKQKLSQGQCGEWRGQAYLCGRLRHCPMIALSTKLLSTCELSCATTEAVPLLGDASPSSGRDLSFSEDFAL